MNMRLALLAATLAIGACTGVSDDPGGGETLAMIDSPGDIAVVGTDLYVVSDARDAYRVLHMSTLGGTPEVLGAYPVVMKLVADADGVFWLANEAGTTRMMAWSPGMAEPAAIFENPTWAYGGTFRNMVLDATSIYYADESGAVWKIPKAGGTATQLGTSDGVGSVALSPDGLWVSTALGAKRLPGGPELGFGTVRPDDIAWADGTLFASYSGSGAMDGWIVRMTMDGGPQELAARLMLPGSLTPYDGYLYLTTGNEDSAVRRVPFTGGGSQALAQGRWPSGISVDEEYVYWSDWQNDRVRRVLH
jgi:hypothetical protein